MTKAGDPAAPRPFGTPLENESFDPRPCNDFTYLSRPPDQVLDPRRLASSATGSRAIFPFVENRRTFHNRCARQGPA